MREFYKQVLKDFHLYCGNRSQMRDWEDAEISKLLDILVKVSEAYNFIPESGQKAIIEAQLIKDNEYTTLNARTVGKWFEQNGKQYFKEIAHSDQTDPNWKPLEGEAREKRIKEYLEAIAKTTTAFTSAMDEGHKGSGSRLRENIEKSSGLKTFNIDGMDIVAFTEAEAIEQRKQIV